MRSTITKLAYFLAFTALLPIPSCSKISLPKCEEWEVTDAKFSMGGCIDWSCGGSRTLQLIFCADALNEAKAGNTVIISEDQCCKKTRTFVRFIRSQ